LIDDIIHADTSVEIRDTESNVSATRNNTEINPSGVTACFTKENGCNVTNAMINKKTRKTSVRNKEVIDNDSLNTAKKRLREIQTTTVCSPVKRSRNSTSTTITKKNRQILPQSEKKKELRQQKKIDQDKKLYNLIISAPLQIEDKNRFHGFFKEFFKIPQYLNVFTTSDDTNKKKAYSKLCTHVRQTITFSRFHIEDGVEKTMGRDHSTRIHDFWYMYINPTSRDSGLKDTGSKDTKMDWFFIRESGIGCSGLGVFANREFMKYEILGLYIGVFIDKEKIQGKSSSPYAVEAPFGIIDAKRGFNSGDIGAYYGMGLHMVNDPNWTMNDEVRGPSNREYNAMLSSAMLVYATKTIFVGEEIFFPYKIKNA